MRQLRGNEMAMIFQEPLTSLNPVFTVGDQIAEQVKLHMKVSDKEARDRAVEMLRLVGIPSPERRVKQYPHELSGGMRQRVMIGMALSCEPKLLIADEPTTALDVTVQAQILELLKDDPGADRRRAAADHPRPRRRRRDGRQRDRHVRRPGRGAGHRRRGAARAADAVHDGPDRVDPDGGEARRPAVGDPGRRPVAVPPAAACRFEPRCPYRWETCREVPPELYPAGEGGRLARCHLHLAEASARRDAAVAQHEQNMRMGRRLTGAPDRTGDA